MTQLPPAAELLATFDERAILAQIVALLEASRRERLAAQRHQIPASATQPFNQAVKADFRGGSEYVLSEEETTRDQE